MSRLPDRTTWTVSLGVALGLGCGGVGPWIVGALVGTGRFDLVNASLMVTIEQMTMGAMMLVLAPALHRLPRKPLLIAGVLLLLIAQGGSYGVNALVGMALARTLSGAGSALIYSVSTAMGAATRDPDRTFAAAQGMTQLAAIILNPMLGVGAELPGHKGVFLVLGAFSLLIGLPFLWLAREAPIPAPTATRPTERAALALPPLVGVLAVMTLFSLATGGAWNFMERVAASVGLGGTRLGTGLIASSVIGVLGSLLANRLGTTRGRAIPLCGGLVLLGLTTLWFMTPGSPQQFWLAVSLWAFLLTFTTPYVFGLAAALDPSGRVVAATGTAYIIVSAAGVYLGAFIVAHAGLRLFGLLALLVLAVTAALAAGVNRMIGSPPRALHPVHQS